MNPARRLLAFSLVVVACGTTACADEIGDGFESGTVSDSVWYLEQFKSHLHDFETAKPREGAKSLIIAIDESVRTCEAPLRHSLIESAVNSSRRCIEPSESVCQRNEIRVHTDLQSSFGSDLWYGFSFRLRGHIPETGSVRWVVGQWKHGGGDSPFLSQRFDNGVFYITIQSGHCRCRITTAPGDPDRMMLANLTKPLNCKDTEKNGDMEGCPCQSDLVVTYADDPALPKPNDGWVDMLYRVRGHPGGSGLIEIYADGIPIARVTGSIGYTGGLGRNQYFKIGNYRDFVPKRAELVFDRFWRGTDPKNFDPDFQPWK